MSPIIKEHVISGVQTFVTTFLVSVGATLSLGDVQWTGAFWASLILIAARAAVKEVWAVIMPKVLGGRR